jgi:hypothetical protein
MNRQKLLMRLKTDQPTRKYAVNFDLHSAVRFYETSFSFQQKKSRGATPQKALSTYREHYLG